MGEPKCTWVIEGRLTDDGREYQCGDKAYVIFSRKVTRMGKPVVQTYPRCRKHAPQRVVQEARSGIGGVIYDVKFIGEEGT